MVKLSNLQAKKKSRAYPIIKKYTAIRMYCVIQCYPKVTCNNIVKTKVPLEDQNTKYGLC